MSVFQGRLKDYSAGRVLDFGTGSGSSARAVIEAVKDFDTIVGLETTDPEQDVAPDLLRARYFEYVQSAGPLLPFLSGSFDTVCMSQVVHHLPPDSRHEVLAELKRALKPGGAFLFVEGYRDQQSGARKTQIICHFLRAVIDRDEGIHHYQTLRRQELVRLVTSMGFEHCEMFDFAPMRADFNDPDNLDNIARFIDREIDKRAHLPRYEQYRRFGERLKKRMYRTGYLGSKSLVAICH